MERRYDPPGIDLTILRIIEEPSPEQLALIWRAAKERYADSLQGGYRHSYSLRVWVRRGLENLMFRHLYQRVASHFVATFFPGGQRILIFDDRSFEAITRDHWTDYYPLEVNRLMEDDSIPLAILSIGACRGDDAEYAGYEYLQELVDNHYYLREQAASDSQAE